MIGSVVFPGGTKKSDITSATALTGGAGDRFTSCVLGGVYVQCNQVNVPKFWTGTGNVAQLTGWDNNWKCKAIRAFKNYLSAMNITKTSTKYTSMVKWSHAAAPGTIPTSWDETDATLDAGEFDLAETNDELVHGLALGETFVCYEERSMYALSYVGG